MSAPVPPIAPSVDCRNPELDALAELIRNESSAQAKTRDRMRFANTSLGTINAGILIALIQMQTGVRADLSIQAAAITDIRTTLAQVQSTQREFADRLTTYQAGVDARLAAAAQQSATLARDLDAVTLAVRTLGDRVEAQERRRRPAAPAAPAAAPAPGN